MPPGRRIPRPPDTPPERPPPPDDSDADVAPDVAKAAGELSALAGGIRTCDVCGPADAPRAYGTGFPRAPVMLVKDEPSDADLESGNAFADEATALGKAFEALQIPLAWLYGTSAVKAAGARPCPTHLLMEVEAVQPTVLVGFGRATVDAFRELAGRCGLSVPEEVAQGEPVALRGDLVLIVTEQLPAGVTEREAKRRLWRDLQAVPKLLAR